ncbi:MAG: DUF362 domain-containing protein [Desulfobacteraceae bacterium]|nr:DUF362 domain-containing protein [Desulfobacteraceae bacterium]
MSIVYKRRSEDREAFVREVFQQLQVQRKVTGKQILIKPNIVSYEPYPTTTHLETLEACLQLLLDVGKKIVVADGPAWDAGDSKSIIERHPLKQSCDEFGVTIADLLIEGTRRVKTRSFELDVSQMAFEYDFILSLPVLKSHSMGLTGALKNQLGFLDGAEKRRSHRERDMNQVIAELNEVVKPHLYIVDAVQTLINANEVRHGGQPQKLGYMLAGTDPVSLDVVGLELLKEVEPKLSGKHFEDIPHLRHAASLGIGEARYEIIEL